MTDAKKVNFNKKLHLFHDLWSPKVIAQMNKKKPDDSIKADVRAMFKNMKPEDLFTHISSVI